MPGNWRGVAECGDKVRSGDRGRGGTLLRGEQLVKSEDTSQDGRRQTLSEAQLMTLSSVRELITSGHVLCSSDKNAFCLTNLSMLTQSQEPVSSNFQAPVTCSGQQHDPPLRAGSRSRLWVKRLPAHSLTRGVSGVDRQAADTPGTSQSPSGGSSGNSFQYRQSIQCELNTQITMDIKGLCRYYQKHILRQ